MKTWPKSDSQWENGKNAQNSQFEPKSNKFNSNHANTTIRVNYYKNKSIYQAYDALRAQGVPEAIGGHNDIRIEQTVDAKHANFRLWRNNQRL